MEGSFDHAGLMGLTLFRESEENGIALVQWPLGVLWEISDVDCDGDASARVVLGERV
jgi:hypothetical protein